jgi:hypothetical protein
LEDSLDDKSTAEFQALLGCALASSLALPQNGLACTIVMRPVLISKFSAPVLTDGPTRTLSTEGAENSQSIFWVMALEVDGAIMIVLTIENDI